MKLSELKEKRVERSIEYGMNEVIFNGAEYIMKKDAAGNDTDDVDLIKINIKPLEENADYDMRPLHIKIFDEERNSNLEFFTAQIKATSYDVDTWKEAIGTVIRVQKYQNNTEAGVFTNTTFNPKEFVVNAQESNVPNLA